MQNNQILISGIPIDVVSLIFTILTSACTLLIAFLALQHTAKPRIKIKSLNRATYKCGDLVTLKFLIFNVGHWYVRPMVIGLVVYCNFQTEFQLVTYIPHQTEIV